MKGLSTAHGNDFACLSWTLYVESTNNSRCKEHKALPFVRQAINDRYVQAAGENQPSSQSSFRRLHGRSRRPLSGRYHVQVRQLIPMSLKMRDLIGTSSNTMQKVTIQRMTHLKSLPKMPFRSQMYSSSSPYRHRSRAL